MTVTVLRNCTMPHKERAICGRYHFPSSLPELYSWTSLLILRREVAVFSGQTNDRSRVCSLQLDLCLPSRLGTRGVGQEVPSQRIFPPSNKSSILTCVGKYSSTPATLNCSDG